ncbi:glycosyltransferase family 2 protein [Algibacter amylolyticus]|uniref:Glycosyltransferase family 2 protein n=1 Tax=Algibacter amylolyticus TaxID=1608400 RepID=A0A5M7B6V5_9FLAO|nr:glycosyltransferase family 2 protein [Algibacter amylolyticus]KAA5824048.1 glycosyltransferase family 2 protein [Algibacter amylolyticus]MBB5269601.1 glycosyltransferase involved in cell wall biosynthesis [Algibacter amylolyticus]TSJ74525.1 glycosyltransferase family 2 protein [Algibacter amylolyticus]
MSVKPFFSVVIPLYNKADYIEATLNSVLNQNYKNFEIVIVNDGSTDTSLMKAKTVLKQFKETTFIEQENKGLSASRNKGISVSKGAIIALLDADDLWHVDYLETIYILYKNFPEASFYGTDYLEKHNASKTIETKKNISPSLKNHSFLIDDFFSLNLFQPIICPSSMAFKKIYNQHSLFDEMITYAEDVDFYLKNLIAHKLAYCYTPCVTNLHNVPNQITQIGIKNKTLPNLYKYEKRNPNDVSLKKYLDFKRYMYANQYKIDQDTLTFNKLTKRINLENLSTKQKILLKTPRLLLLLLEFIKKMLLKQNIRVTSFKY